MEIDINDYTGFVVTGVKYITNQRFQLNYSGTVAGFHTANQISLWKGSMWGITKEGKRKLLKRVIN